jgi:hypothetical protein
MRKGGKEEGGKSAVCAISFYSLRTVARSRPSDAVCFREAKKTLDGNLSTSFCRVFLPAFPKRPLSPLPSTIAAHLSPLPSPQTHLFPLLKLMLLSLYSC